MIPLFVYDILIKEIYWENGKPYWLISNGSSVHKDDVAGTLIDGYRSIFKRINDKPYRVLAHRLRFYTEYGWLPQQVDHINRVRDDNRIENLRDAKGQNRRNVRSKTNATSKYVGVLFTNNKWKSGYTVNKKHYHVGYFDTELEAAQARDEMIIKNNHDDFSTLNLKKYGSQ